MTGHQATATPSQTRVGPPWWLALGMALGLLAGPASAQEQRYALHDPKDTKPGGFLAMYQQLRTPSEDMLAREVQLLGGAEQHEKLRSGLAAKSEPDGAADFFIRSIDGIVRNALQAAFFKRLKTAKPGLQVSVRDLTSIVNLPNGRSIPMPLFSANALHRLNARITAESRLVSGTIRELSGRYRLDAGDGCKIASGEVTLSQQDFVVEGVRDGHATFVAAAGGQYLYLLPNEPRFATLLQAAGDVTIDAPDEPSDLLRGTLADPAMTLESVVGKACRITLVKLT